jgi:hypothetical protein
MMLGRCPFSAQVTMTTGTGFSMVPGFQTIFRGGPAVFRSGIVLPGGIVFRGGLPTPLSFFTAALPLCFGDAGFMSPPRAA